MDIGSIATSVASGGILGLLGPIATGLFGIFKGWMEHKQQVELIKLQSDAKMAEAASAIAVAREQAAGAAFTASIQAEGSIKGESRWVKDLRGSTRPGLTWLGLIASFICGLFSIQNDLTLTLNGYTGMMIAWWFGQRAIDKTMIAWGTATTKASVSTTPSTPATPAPVPAAAKEGAK